MRLRGEQFHTECDLFKDYSYTKCTEECDTHPMLYNVSSSGRVCLADVSHMHSPLQTAESMCRDVTGCAGLRTAHEMGSGCKAVAGEPGW